ncbi:Kinase-like protein [Mycena sanguinolenta]|uniref:Kinase-like protein n=1 Tax=Mycena sanguinolenta TaxID=230812 RepID=A0A8H6Z647_9AGAR|nr:Kinase-like protein [Mycena sanguinolenta]
MSLHAAWDVIIGVTPVPGLQSAFTVFKFIVSYVQNVRTSRQQLVGLANAVGQLLATLQREFQSSKLTVGSCAQPLDDLQSLLKDIHKFLQTEQDRSFLKALFHGDSRISAIEMFYRRIGTTTTAFQISASLNIQNMLRDNERARIEDAHALTERFVVLRNDHDELRRELNINHKNMLAMMVSIERRIEENRGGNIPEQDFYAHAQHYLSLTSGKQVKLEDWMISAFDVDYEAEIGAGGFGTVFKGTWNRTEVAIKLIHNGSGIAANVEMLRKEIDIWMTLRHPNILQFLGANTLDDKPFVVMPLMPYNSREFLRIRPSWDPLYILRDISLGLEYLHGRKICHGDLKGINVLIEDSGRALLCDFGLARIKADITSRTRTAGDTVISGSRNWMAPELLSGSLPRPPSDIYAFGMTIYELYTDANPLATIPYSDFIELVYRIGVRPERPEDDECPRMNDGIWDLADRCWNKDAKARPTARQVHDTIKILMLGFSREPVTATPSEQASRRIHSPPPIIQPPSRRLHSTPHISSPRPLPLPPPPPKPETVLPTEDQREILPSLEDIRLMDTRKQDQDLHLTVKFITDDTFAVHDGFDLALLDDKNGWPASNISTFQIPRQQPYRTFKSRTAKHFGYPEDRIRLWVLMRRQNQTIRAENSISDSSEGTLSLDHIQKNMCSATQNDLLLYLEILSESQSERPPNSIMIFLKHFDQDKQTLRGAGHILKIKSEKIGNLVAAINERMQWPPSTPLKLYEEMAERLVEVTNPRLTFRQNEIQSGDIICFEVDISQDERRKLESKGLRSNAISHYDFLRNRVMILFQPSLYESNEDTPQFTLVLSKKDSCATMSKMVSEYLRHSPGVELWMSTKIGDGSFQHIGGAPERRRDC